VRGGRRSPNWRILLLRVAAAVAAAILGALAAVLEALLQGSLVSIRNAVIFAAALGVISLLTQIVQAWIEHLRHPADEHPEWDLSDLQARLARADLMDQMREWTATELDRSLGRLADMQLGFAMDPEAVDYVLRRPNEPDQPIERGTPVRALYERLGHQLLLLGEPGAGKTTLLFELARSLLEDAQRSREARVPVVFRLPSWAVDRRPLDAWLADVLSRDYGVSPRLARLWVATEQLIPLLDGLDEVAEPHRAACLEAINGFHEEHGQLPLLVCSRVQEYEELPSRLRLRGALVIQPLTKADVLAYVRRARRQLPGLRAAVEHDPGLCELLTTPLLLNIAALTYQGKPAPLVQAGGTLVERRRRVLADYVRAMLHGRPAGARRTKYPPGRTLIWLSWLARAMQAHGQTVFYVDRLQPDWLPTGAQRRLATTAATAAAVLLHLLLTAGLAAVALAIAVQVGGRSVTPGVPVTLLLPRLAPLLLLGLAGGAALALAVHDRRIEPMRWSRRAFRRALPPNLVLGVVVGPLLAVLGALLIQPTLRASLVLLSSAALGLPIGLGVSLWFAIAAGYESPVDLAPAAPGWDIDNLGRTARVNALVSLLVVGPVVAAVCGLAFQLSIGAASLATMAIAGLFAVLLVALFAALQLGGAAYLRHVALRLLLFRDGYAAWDMVDFLAHAARLNLLRRQGGGYEFVHPLLRQWFAELGEERPARAPGGAAGAARTPGDGDKIGAPTA
jgi:hypothetical protein